MDNWQQFEALAACARAETGSPVEVTAGVLREIRRTSAGQRADVPLWLFSGLSLVAASIVLLLAIQTWTAATDPLSALFDALTMVMQ